MHLFPNKKGVSLLMMAFGTIIIALVAFLLFISVAGNHSKSDDFLLTYHAEDFQLLIESMQAVPGDVAVPFSLTEGMELELTQDRFAIIHTESEIEKKRWLHLTHGMQVKPGTGVGSFTLTKEGNLISISGGSLFLGGKDTCKNPTLRKDFSVSLSSGRTTTIISAERVQRVIESIEYYLDKNNIDVENAAELSLTISFMDEERPTLMLRRPKTDSIGEADYNYLFCSLAKTFGDEFTVTESFTHTTNRFNAELFIGLPANMQEDFYKERPTFASKLALILTGFQDAREEQNDA